MLVPENPRPSAIQAISTHIQNASTGQLTVERVTTRGIRLDHCILDVQIIRLDPRIPSDRLTRLEAVDLGIVNLKRDQVRAIGEAALPGRVGVPPCLAVCWGHPKRVRWGIVNAGKDWTYIRSIP